MEWLCEIAYAYVGKDYLLSGNTWLISSVWNLNWRTFTDHQISLCCILHQGNTRTVCPACSDICVPSVSARFERSRVGQKWHPCGNCAQRPQCCARERRAHFHETTDGECECHDILLFTFVPVLWANFPVWFFFGCFSHLKPFNLIFSILLVMGKHNGTLIEGTETIFNQRVATVPVSGTDPNTL